MGVSNMKVKSILDSDIFTEGSVITVKSKNISVDFIYDSSQVSRYNKQNVLTRLKEEKDLDRILNSDILKIENEKSFRTGVGILTLSIGGL